MIYQFTFENFRSYRSETTIDFVAKPIDEHQDSLLSPEYTDIHLLPIAAIYGPNGGGKSNVLFALARLKELITKPLSQLNYMLSKNEDSADQDTIDLPGNKSNDPLDGMYYKFDDSFQFKPIKFGILFQINNYKYKYELVFLNNYIDEENLFLEDLETGNLISVFERDMDGIYLCDEIGQLDVDRINANLPLLSYISMFKDIDLIDNVINFFYNIRLLNFDRPSLDRKVPTSIIETYKKRVLHVINSMGIDICDFRFVKDDDGNISEIYTQHRLADNKIMELKLTDESSGTRKVITLIPRILKYMDKGSLFIIDELDAKLHPKLLRSIIELFTSNEINNNGSQLLFTSHDLTTMTGEIFRRDEIWFAAFNSLYESVLYSLVDFKKKNGKKPRNDDKYNKQYLEGRYGADPYMIKILNWEDLQCL